MAESMAVEVVAVEGSAPREVGASMIVSGSGQTGTIGGGRLEYEAIAHARACLAAGMREDQEIVRLGPEIGQCCGGHVTLHLTPADAPPAPRPVRGTFI